SDTRQRITYRSRITELREPGVVVAHAPPQPAPAAHSAYQLCNRSTMVAMTNDIPMHMRNPRLLSLAIYLSLGVLMSMSLVLVESATAKAIIAVLCLAFALVHTFHFPKASGARHQILYFA